MCDMGELVCHGGMIVMGSTIEMVTRCGMGEMVCRGGMREVFCLGWYG